LLIKRSTLETTNNYLRERYLVGGSSSSLTITLFSDGELDTLTLGERDPRLGTLTDGEDVGDTSSKDTIESILDVDDFETTNVTFTVNQLTDTTNITTTSDQDNVTNFELDEIGDLVFFEVETNGIVSLDQRIGVTDSTTIMGGDVRNTLGTNEDLLDLTELVLGLFISDTVNSETTLDIIDKTEVFTSLFNRDDIHETSGEGGISTDLVVNLDQTLHEDRLDFTTVKSVLQTVTDEDDQRKTLTGLVGTGRGLRGIRTYI
jgi:hypothetical protein